VTAGGSSTSIAGSVTKKVAVTMKMIRSTSITSVSGVMLISAMIVPLLLWLPIAIVMPPEQRY
jgi:hypothetical protein